MTRNKAIILVAAAMAMGIAPDPVVRPSVWAAENLVIVDGPRAGQKWDPLETPYLVEIMDRMAPNDPCNRVSVRKSHQIGYTQTATGWMGSVIAVTPAKALVVFPTINSGQDYNREKFHPAIEDTTVLNQKVMGARSRSARASTSLNKRFPGGTITITGANSSADLRSKTVKYVFADEIDEWPLDLDGQGDPMEMVDARQTAFHAIGEYKKLEGSTPTIKGASRIEEAFLDGDQRFWNVPCPHCGEFQKLIFKHLKFEKTFPHQAAYVCQECGVLIEHHEKRAMVQAGKWVPERPEPGRHHSYHIDTLVSLLTTWDKIVEKFLASKDDPTKLKTYVNLWLGQVWEEKGDAPEWQRLFARRDNYPRRTVPAGGLVLTAAADIQGDGIFYEVMAWGAGEQSWSIDVGFLEGDTGAADNPVWRKLDEVYARRYGDAWGNGHEVEAFAVDSGFNTEAVYAWVRRYPKAFAIKGMDGWHRPPMGLPSGMDVNWKGKRKRGGLNVWPVGTWGLKAKLYGNLRKDGMREGATEDPPGYCYFSEFHDDRYFKQLTAEYLADRKGRNGKVRKEWVASGPNHLHDCRIYNMALAAHLGVPDLTAEEWTIIARDRNMPAEQGQADMADLWVQRARDEAAEAMKHETENESARDDLADDWLGGRGGDDWLER